MTPNILRIAVLALAMAAGTSAAQTSHVDFLKAVEALESWVNEDSKRLMAAKENPNFMRRYDLLDSCIEKAVNLRSAIREVNTAQSDLQWDIEGGNQYHIENGREALSIAQNRKSRRDSTWQEWAETCATRFNAARNELNRTMGSLNVQGIKQVQ